MEPSKLESTEPNELESIDLLLSNLRFIAEQNNKMLSERQTIEWTTYAGLITFFVVIFCAAIQSKVDFSQYYTIILWSYTFIVLFSIGLLISMSRAHQKNWERSLAVNNLMLDALQKGNLLIDTEVSKLIIKPIPNPLLEWLRRWFNCGLQIGFLIVIAYLSFQVIIMDKPPKSESPQINQTQMESNEF